MTGKQLLIEPIERDESYDRTYIPLPGGWEVQTKGRGSSFRICNTKTGRRLMIPDQPFVHELLEQMAREIHAACAQPAAQPSVRDGSTLQSRLLDTAQLSMLEPWLRALLNEAADALDKLAAQGEAVAWQSRWIDPEEGPSLWSECRESDIETLRRAGHEIRSLYPHPPQQSNAERLAD